jgi:hypothetical protein
MEEVAVTDGSRDSAVLMDVQRGRCVVAAAEQACDRAWLSVVVQCARWPQKTVV